MRQGKNEKIIDRIMFDISFLNLFFMLAIIDSAISLDHARSQNNYLETLGADRDEEILNALRVCWRGRPEEDIEKIEKKGYEIVKDKKIIEMDFIYFEIKNGQIVDVFYSK